MCDAVSSIEVEKFKMYGKWTALTELLQSKSTH